MADDPGVVSVEPAGGDPGWLTELRASQAQSTAGKHADPGTTEHRGDEQLSDGPPATKKLPGNEEQAAPFDYGPDVEIHESNHELAQDFASCGVSPDGAKAAVAWLNENAEGFSQVAQNAKSLQDLFAFARDGLRATGVSPTDTGYALARFEQYLRQQSEQQGGGNG